MAGLRAHRASGDLRVPYHLSIKITDRGASYLFRRAAELANRVTFGVGVPADAGNYPNGTPIPVVAAAHEFGLGVPQRSFIRGWFDEKGPQRFMSDFAVAAQTSLIRGTELQGLLKARGDQYVAELQQRMDQHIDPALQDATVTRKHAHGSSTPETPLEDTHLLRNSIKVTFTGVKP